MLTSRQQQEVHYELVALQGAAAAAAPAAPMLAITDGDAEDPAAPVLARDGDADPAAPMAVTDGDADPAAPMAVTDGDATAAASSNTRRIAQAHPKWVRSPAPLVILDADDNDDDDDAGVAANNADAAAGPVARPFFAPTRWSLDGVQPKKRPRRWH